MGNFSPFAPCTSLKSNEDLGNFDERFPHSAIAAVLGGYPQHKVSLASHKRNGNYDERCRDTPTSVRSEADLIQQVVAW
jgi:hypothetical protein